MKMEGEELEGWKERLGRMGGSKVGRLEGWKDGRLEGRGRRQRAKTENKK